MKISSVILIILTMVLIRFFSGISNIIGYLILIIPQFYLLGLVCIAKTKNAAVFMLIISCVCLMVTSFCISNAGGGLDGGVIIIEGQILELLGLIILTIHLLLWKDNFKPWKKNEVLKGSNK